MRNTVKWLLDDEDYNCHYVGGSGVAAKLNSNANRPTGERSLASRRLTAVDFVYHSAIPRRCPLLYSDKAKNMETQGSKVFALPGLTILRHHIWERGSVRIRRLLAPVGLLLMIGLLAGCGSKQPQGQGQIVGRVINAAQIGLAGAKVTTDDGKTATTDADGRYSVSQVAAGTRTLSATLAGYSGASAAERNGLSGVTLKKGDDGFLYLMRGGQKIQLQDVLQPSASQGQVRAQGFSGTTTVNVRANTTTTASDIVLTPQVPNVDNVSLVGVTPTLGSALTAGSSQKIDATYHYTLHSANEGVIALYMAYETSDGKLGIVDESVYGVTKGSSTHSISKTITVPHAPYFVYLMQLFDAQGEQRALNVVYAYTVAGAETPQAATLEAVANSSDSFTISWTGGKPYNFAEYRLYRSQEPSVPSGSDSTLVASFTTPVDSYTDNKVYLGKSVYYKLYLVTLDGHLYPSEVAKVDVPQVALNAFAPAGYMVMDPVRPRTYLLNPKVPNSIEVYSTTTASRSSVALPCTAAKMAITSDGTKLVATCTNANQALLVNLNTSEVQPIGLGGLTEPTNVIISPDNTKAYVEVRSNFAVLDLVSETVVHQGSSMSSSKNLALIDDGNILVSRYSYVLYYYYTNNLAFAGQLSSLDITVKGMVESPAENLLYLPTTEAPRETPLRGAELSSGTYVLSGTYPASRLSYLGGQVYAVGPVTNKAYSFFNMNGAWYLRTYSHTNGFWQQQNQVGLSLEGYPPFSVLINPDETKLYISASNYYGSSTSDYQVLDLSTLATGEDL